MAPSHAQLFETFKAVRPNLSDSVARLDALATLLDSAFLIPGTNQRVGLDAIIGLVPVVGDLITTAISSYIIWEARQLGLPRWKIARMIANIAIDGALGAIPIVGDAFDVMFRANRMNMRIIRDHLERTGAVPRTIEGQAVRIDR